MQIHRREFLKRGLAAGALLSSAGALWTSCSGIRRDDLHTAPVADGTLAGLSKRHMAIPAAAIPLPTGSTRAGDSNAWPCWPAKAALPSTP